MRILVVDDNRDAREILARLLRMSGHEAIGVETCAEAIRVTSAERFNVGLIDINLPDGSGMDLMRRLSAQEEFCGIVVSGHEFEDPDGYRAAGFSAHLMKPVDFTKLTKLIEECST